MQRPLALLTFSYTPSRELVFDDSAMRYFKDPPIGAPLGRDYERWIRRPEERSRLDGLLECLLHDVALPETKRAQLVTWRGVMTRLITAPYESRDGWELNAMMINGTLYLEEHLTGEKLAEKENMTPQHRLMSYYGYAFESYCTAEYPPGPQSGGGDGWGGRVDTNVQWCAVVKTKLAQNRIILGAEVDCVRDVFTGQPETFVELKTTMAGNDRAFRKKLIKFWAQSYLLGIPEIVVGFRTHDGRIESTQSINTLEIPSMARGDWDGGICLDFGSRLITHVGSYIRHHQRTADDQGRVWRLSFRPNAGVNIRELGQAEVDEVVNGEDRIGFLPTTYLRDLAAAFL